jgi:hypothetical protein
MVVLNLFQHLTYSQTGEIGSVVPTTSFGCLAQFTR